MNSFVGNIAHLSHVAGRLVSSSAKRLQELRPLVLRGTFPQQPPAGLLGCCAPRLRPWRFLGALLQFLFPLALRLLLFFVVRAAVVAQLAQHAREALAVEGHARAVGALTLQRLLRRGLRRGGLLVQLHKPLHRGLVLLRSFREALFEPFRLP